ncbi:hypothetical protein TrLO_g7232 [Triparma laevis f. longispina]|uniref:Tyrosine-protein kinase ephrin type A/B receptor-like domain-containing protein n=1 Tax=Triparma laevis f. longispina TaxID=1714387 RepID=A0A9W6ZKR0_9STRA|nr:hypothetical protein TrLO_g7232 [Triparma laevis f. longispina]
MRSVNCKKCTASERLNDEGDGCGISPDGTYSNPGSPSCTDCEHTHGYVSLAGDSGAAQCTYCGPGFYADQISQTCKECEIDTYSVGGIDTCLVCPSEYAEFGAPSCSACLGPKEYSDVEGAAFCSIAKTCGRGTYIVTASTTTSDAECGDCYKGIASAGDQALCNICDSEGE